MKRTFVTSPVATMKSAALGAGLGFLLFSPSVAAQVDGAEEQVQEEEDRRAGAGPGADADTARVSGEVRPEEVRAAAARSESKEASRESVLDALGRLKLSLVSFHELHTYNNRDFRAVDESSDLAVINSDDRTTFGHSDVNVAVAYEANEKLSFRTRLKYDVLWRDDQLGRTGSTGDLNLFELYFDYTPYKSEQLEVGLSLGRQAFRIGGIPRDYMLEGTVDAGVISADFRQAKVRLMADIFGANDLPVNGFQSYGEGRSTVAGLRGETNTMRAGGILELTEDSTPLKGLMAKAYYFYASIGGGPIEETGADITYGGLLGNFRDADYQHMMGFRAGYTIGDKEGPHHAQVYGEVAHSEGIDRKNPVAFDVDTAGNAFGGGLWGKLRIGESGEFGGGADFYHFQGPTYSSNGLEFQRGFVGMRGARVGNLAGSRHLALRPSAHVDAFGVNHTPQDQERASGTQFLHANVHGALSRYSLTLDWWMYKDTGETKVTDFDSLPNPPFGYAVEEFRAQERLGKTMGQEVNALFAVEAAEEMLVLFAEAGLFFPGDFYSTEVARVAGKRNTALGGEETFWVVRSGAQVKF